VRLRVPRTGLDPGALDADVEKPLAAVRQPPLKITDGGVNSPAPIEPPSVVQKGTRHASRHAANLHAAAAIT
jgi:hypothetical protein